MGSNRNLVRKSSRVNDMIIEMEQQNHVRYYPGMDGVGESSTANVSRRMRLVRKVLVGDGRGAQTEFADRVAEANNSAFPRSMWNNIETGDHRISVNAAIKVMHAFPSSGMSLDFVFLGWRDKLSHDFREAFREEERR